MSNVLVFEAALASALATDGTLDIPYPAGVAQADIKSGGEVFSVPALQNVLAQASDTFTLSYDSDSVTVTYKDATTVPAGTIVRLQVNRAVAEDPLDPVVIPPATTTARGGVKQAAVQAASTATDAAGVVTDLNALLTKLKTAGIMASS